MDIRKGFSSRYSSEANKVLEQRFYLEYFNEVFPNKEWFIAGSFAIPSLEYNDVDVFFKSEKSYKESLQAVSKIADKQIIVTPKAATITTRGNRLDVVGNTGIQLVNCNFGSPSYIFKLFDINVCRQAILPDGERIVCETVSNPLCIENPNYSSFSRFLKYLQKIENSGHEIDAYSLYKSAVDKYITNDDYIVDFYKDKKIEEPVNYVMYRSLNEELKHVINAKEDYVLNCAEAISYLKKATEMYAPELMI